MLSNTLFSLAKNLGPCLGYSNVIEFLSMYKTDQEKFLGQIYYLWVIRGQELKEVFGYILYFHHTWCMRKISKREGIVEKTSRAELIVTGVTMDSLARGAAPGFFLQSRHTTLLLANFSDFFRIFSNFLHSLVIKQAQYKTHYN